MPISAFNPSNPKGPRRTAVVGTVRFTRRAAGPAGERRVHGASEGSRRRDDLVGDDDLGWGADPVVLVLGLLGGVAIGVHVLGAVGERVGRACVEGELTEGERGEPLGALAVVMDPRALTGFEPQNEG